MCVRDRDNTSFENVGVRNEHRLESDG
jgi:hypothetical protein